MNSGSVGDLGRSSGIEASSVNSKDGPPLGRVGEQVSQNHTTQLTETLTNGKKGSFVQLFQHKPKETFTIEGELQFPAISEQDGWKESLDQAIELISPHVESLAGAIVDGSVPILEYVSQDNFIEVFKADVSKLTTDTIQTIYNQNPEFFDAISSGAEITQESAKKFLENVLRETVQGSVSLTIDAFKSESEYGTYLEDGQLEFEKLTVEGEANVSTAAIAGENVVEFVQTYVGGFIEKIHDEDFQQQISNNINDFSTCLVDQLQTAYGSMSDLVTAINENVDLLGQLVIGEGDDASWELQPPNDFKVSGDNDGFFQILSDAWNAATRQTIAGNVRLAPGVSEVFENMTETIAGEVQIKEGVEYLNTLTLNQINAYPTQIKERLDQNESVEDKLQTLASCAKNLENAAKFVRTSWKDQAYGVDDICNKFLKDVLPKLSGVINKLQDLDSLNDSDVLQIEKKLYTLKEGFDEVVGMLGETDLKPFFESAMKTSLALINGAYGAIRSSGSIDEASQHFDNRQAVLDASDALDPVFDDLNTLLGMNGFTDVLKKDGPQPIDVKNNDDKSLADFLDSNNISQAAFFVFRSACNDLKDLKVKLEFSDSDKSKLAKVKTEVEQLYGDSSIESKVNDALIEMRKPDYSPIDREKARQVIQKHFGERLNQLEKD